MERYLNKGVKLKTFKNIFINFLCSPVHINKLKIAFDSLCHLTHISFQNKIKLCFLIYNGKDG